MGKRDAISCHLPFYGSTNKSDFLFRLINSSSVHFEKMSEQEIQPPSEPGCTGEDGSEKTEEQVLQELVGKCLNLWFNCVFSKKRPLNL